ncbi:MAG: hypothetical protein Q8O55_13470 [Dehalococcoidales bacterium]|nr:hypothetical protein [Dehalococcoidales bacterium]
MNFDVMQASVMAGQLGDIFWDLAPWIVYDPGYDLGCNIYVANPTDTAKEYALMARLSSGTTVISEEALPVFGYTWFTVEPGDLVTLKGALRFNESNADLTVSLVERESGQVTDTVVTSLVAQTTSALPPGWPGAPGTGTTETTWSSMLGTMMPMFMIGVFGMVMVSAFKPQKETTKLPSGG